MINLLYHRVHPKNLDAVLESNSIKAHKDIIGNQICMTRNVVYMSASRPYVAVFDRDKLKKFFKVQPFCLLGWKFTNKTNDFERWKKMFSYGFESEERVIAKEIPLELAEYFGILEAGCFDYKHPTKVHSHRIFERTIEENRIKKGFVRRSEIRKVFLRGLKDD